MARGKGRWQDGAGCAVCLTFDVDGESLWIGRDPALAERPMHMAMGAYGPKVGVPRILALLDRHRIKAGFFIPAWTVERYPDMAREIARRGHEIGHHGYLHEKPFTLSGPEEEEQLLVKAVSIIQEVTGVRTLGSRTPSCDPSKHTMRLLKKHGFVYHSNMMDSDDPYVHGGEAAGLIELPTSWPLDDFIFFGFSGNPPVGNGIWSQQEVWEIWVEEFEGAYAAGGYYNLMMHPQVIGRHHRMRMVERLVRHMRAKGDVWFATPLQIARYWADHLAGSAPPHPPRGRREEDPGGPAGRRGAGEAPAGRRR